MSSSVNKDKDIYLGAIKASWVNPGQLGQEVSVLVLSTGWCLCPEEPEEEGSAGVSPPPHSLGGCQGLLAPWKALAALGSLAPDIGQLL